MPLPARIQNAPELMLGLEFYYGAFLDLNTCRPTGWDILPIPWSAMSDYAQMMGLDAEERDDLFFFVTSLDSAFRSYHQAKAEKQRKVKGDGARKFRKTNVPSG